MFLEKSTIEVKVAPTASKFDVNTFKAALLPALPNNFLILFLISILVLSNSLVDNTEYSSFLYFF